MFSTGSHRRFRDQLSAYVDGELRASAAERLEAHLAACEGCRLEMEQLRATTAALRDLAEIEVPRSFTLSPERAAARRPLTGAAAPFALGMRLAAAGLAVALAAVFVVDLGGLADDNPAGTAVPEAASDRNAEYGAPDGAAATPTSSPPATGAELRVTPQPPDTTAEADAHNVNPPPGATDGTSQNADLPPTEGSDGIDALTVAEIGLAAALGLLVLGGGVLAYAGREKVIR